MASVTRCLCCDHVPVEPYLYLGAQPLANSYHHGEHVLPTYPLGVSLCPRCFHSQLTGSVPAREMFDHYLYVSGTSRTLLDYFRGLVDEVLAAWSGGAPPHVLEIGCNDGTLLALFRERGCRVLGVDPARNLRTISEEKGLPVLPRYWTGALADETAGGFDVVLAVNVLPHVPDPAGFLAGCRKALAPGGKLYVQTSQCDMIRKSEFDAIYHEHHSYFTAYSFKVLCDRVQLRISSVRKVPIHSQSFLFTLTARSEKPPYPGWTSAIAEHGEGLRDLLAEEVEHGLMDRRTYLRFANAAARTQAALLAVVAAQRAAGRSVIGYGASAKGNVVLNYAGIDLDYIVDDNPLKWGYLTPGRNIRIRPPDTLQAEAGPLAILCLAWNFEEEIIERVRTLRGTGRGDRMLFYVPEMREVAL